MQRINQKTCQMISNNTSIRCPSPWWVHKIMLHTLSPLEFISIFSVFTAKTSICLLRRSIAEGQGCDWKDSHRTERLSILLLSIHIHRRLSESTGGGAISGAETWPTHQCGVYSVGAEYCVQRRRTGSTGIGALWNFGRWQALGRRLNHPPNNIIKCYISTQIGIDCT